MLETLDRTLKNVTSLTDLAVLYINNTIHFGLLISPGYLLLQIFPAQAAEFCVAKQKSWQP